MSSISHYKLIYLYHYKYNKIQPLIYTQQELLQLNKTQKSISKKVYSFCLYYKTVFTSQYGTVKSQIFMGVKFWNFGKYHKISYSRGIKIVKFSKQQKFFFLIFHYQDPKGIYFHKTKFHKIFCQHLSQKFIHKYK